MYTLTSKSRDIIDDKDVNANKVSGTSQEVGQVEVEIAIKK